MYYILEAVEVQRKGVKFMEAIFQDRRYTYEEWLELDTGNVRTELVDGYVYALASPSLFHQSISGELYVQFRQYLQGKTCRVFQAVDVKLEKTQLLRLI